MNSGHRQMMLVVFIGLSLFAGCTSGMPTTAPAPSPEVLTPIPATATLPPTPVPPTVTTPTAATPTIASESQTATAILPAAPTATPTEMRVNIFLIALEDNGLSGEPVGCGDSAVPVERVIPFTVAPLRAALEELFSLREPYYGESGLYNALYRSDLQVEGISIHEGIATIDLSGTLVLVGTCEDPRIAAQITKTALQFSTISDAVIFINGVPLEELLSLK